MKEIQNVIILAFCISAFTQSKECISKCPKYIRQNMICASDGKMYVDMCQAKCLNPFVTLIIDCEFPVNESACQMKCDKMISEGGPSHEIPPFPDIIVNPPSQTCSRRGRVCSYEGNVFNNECHLNRASSDELRFRCKENGFKSKRACKRVCNQFRNNSCMRNCFDNQEPWACFQDGKIRRDRCWAKCNGVPLKWECKGSKRRCARKCRRNSYY